MSKYVWVVHGHAFKSPGAAGVFDKENRLQETPVKYIRYDAHIEEVNKILLREFPDFDTMWDEND